MSLARSAVDPTNKALVTLVIGPTPEGNFENRLSKKVRVTSLRTTRTAATRGQARPQRSNEREDEGEGGKGHHPEKPPR